MNPFSVFTAEAIGYLSSLFVFLIGVGALLVVVLFVRDVTQTKDAIRRNFPVIGRFRLGQPFIRRWRQHRRIRLDAKSLPGRHGDLRQLSVSDLG